MWRFDFNRADVLRLRLMPVRQDYRLQAAALLAVTAVVVIVFRYMVEAPSTNHADAT
jgi:hypothetical protein